MDRLESALFVGVVGGLGIYIVATVFVILDSIVPIWILLALIVALSVFAFVVDLLTPGAAVNDSDE